MPLSGIGFGEMLVIAMLVLIVFGPRRLPEITRSMGKAVREFKRGMNEIQRELEVADREARWRAPQPPRAGDDWATDSASASSARSRPSGAERPVIAGPEIGGDGSPSVAPTEAVPRSEPASSTEANPRAEAAPHAARPASHTAATGSATEAEPGGSDEEDALQRELPGID